MKKKKKKKKKKKSVFILIRKFSGFEGENFYIFE